MAGPTGPIGPSGPAGSQGIAGPTGTQGATLVGPAGRAGDQGVAGATGQTGPGGAQGYATPGNVGAMGSAGVAGAQGSVGPSGTQGPVGIVDRWTSYRVVNFDYARSDLNAANSETISEVAAYMAKNPSLRAGIDGYMDPNNQELSDRRVQTVRDALIIAGVPSYNILMGPFGDQKLSRDRRVEVLLVTSGYGQNNQNVTQK